MPPFPSCCLQPPSPTSSTKCSFTFGPAAGLLCGAEVMSGNRLAERVSGMSAQGGGAEHALACNARALSVVARVATRCVVASESRTSGAGLAIYWPRLNAAAMKESSFVRKLAV
jgi:hypothetical protein